VSDVARRTYAEIRVPLSKSKRSVHVIGTLSVQGAAVRATDSRSGKKVEVHVRIVREAVHDPK